MKLAMRLFDEGLLSRIYTGSGDHQPEMRRLYVARLAGGRAIASARSFSRQSLRDPAKVFMLNLGYTNFAPLLRIRRPDSKIVLRIGGILSSEAGSRRPLARLRYLASANIACHAAHRIIVQGSYMRDDLLGLMPWAAPKIRVIYNFIEDELWNYAPQAQPPIDRPYIFIAAGFRPVKAFDILIPAFAASPARASRKLVIAGVEPHNDALRALLRESVLGPDEVVCLGYKPHPYEWIAHADVCVLSSRYEGFSNFLLEAAALGKRIVATDCPGGNAEFAAFYGNVEQVPVDNVPALAQALATPRLDIDRNEARRRLVRFERNSVHAEYRSALFDWSVPKPVQGRGAASAASQSASLAIVRVSGGGAEKITMEIARALHERRRLHTVYASGPEDEAATGVPVTRLEGERASRSILQFTRKARSDPSSAFLLTLGYANFAPALRAVRPKSRIVLRIGNTIGPELAALPFWSRRRYLAGLKLACRFADRIVAQSHYMARDLLTYMPWASRKLVVIHNFVEESLWREAAPAEPPIERPYIFCAASNKHQKAYDIMLAAFAASPARAARALVVAGVSPLDEDFNRMMRENGLGEDEVIRLGFIDNPYAWIAHADLCALASRFEGFSNFLLEAAALGKLIVATDCPGGNGELFERYRNIVPVPVDEVEPLAQALASARCDLSRAEARSRLADFEFSRNFGAYMGVLFGGTEP